MPSSARAGTSHVRAQPLDVLGGVDVVVGRITRCEGVGAAVVAVTAISDEVGHPVIARLELRLVAHFLRSKISRQSNDAGQAEPRRSTATIGRPSSTSPPARDNHFGNATDDGRSEPRGEHQRAGVGWGGHRAGANYPDGQGADGVVDRIEVDVVAGALHRDPGWCRVPRPGEHPRRAVAPGQVVLRGGDRRWPIRRRRGGVPAAAALGVGGVPGIGGQTRRAAGQQRADREECGKGATRTCCPE